MFLLIRIMERRHFKVVSTAGQCAFDPFGGCVCECVQLVCLGRLREPE